MSLLQTAFATLLVLGFLGLIAVTAITVSCPAEGLSIATVVKLYGCR
jgi:hypothetical protein